MEIQYSPFTVLVFMVIEKDETLLLLVFLVKREYPLGEVLSCDENSTESMIR